MKYRKLLCVAMVLALLLGLSGSGLALTLDTITTGPMGTVTGIVEEKIYSKATLEDDFADDRVLVVLNNAASLKLKTYTAADFPEIQCASVSDLSSASTDIARAKISNEKAYTATASTSSAVDAAFSDIDLQEYNQILCLELQTTGKQNVLDTIKKLESREDVMYVGPDYAYRSNWITPNDSLYGNQWAPLAILLPQAWDINTGSSSIKVGILSSGIQANHPDLSGRVNVNLSRDCTSGQAVGVTSVTDSLGAGTLAAGIIAAKGNNGSGIAGVAWNCTLVSLKITEVINNDEIITYSSYAIAAIDYARTAHIPILCLTEYWRGGEGNDYYNSAMETAIDSYPGLFVCPAGDQHRDVDIWETVYPANFTHENILCVTASTVDDTRWHEYGDITIFGQEEFGGNSGQASVDIFAPGHNIMSTYINSSYIQFSSTAASAAYAAGVAALMLSECPSLTTEQLKERIMNQCDTIPEFRQYCYDGGRLNAYKALNNIHNFTGYAQNNHSTHFRTCACGERKPQPESHTFTQVGIQYVCLHCGYITTSP